MTDTVDSTKANIEDTISRLTDELSIVTPLPHPFYRILPWMGVAFVYTFFVVMYLGVRPDAGDKMYDFAFVFEIVMAVSLALSAGVCAAFLCVPDMRGRTSMLFVPVGICAVFLGWTVFRSVTEGLMLPAPHWDHCFQDALLVGTVPAAFMIFMTTRGASTRPYMQSFMVALLVMAVGYTALRFTCMMDTVGHSMIYHLFPFVVFGVLGGVCARRIFSW